MKFKVTLSNIKWDAKPAGPSAITWEEIEASTAEVAVRIAQGRAMGSIVNSANGILSCDTSVEQVQDSCCRKS